MPLPTSGDLSLLDIVGEFGGPGGLTSYYRGGTYVPDTPINSGIPTSGSIDIRDFLGASADTVNITDQSYESTPGGSPAGGQYCGYMLSADGTANLTKRTSLGNPVVTPISGEWLIEGSASDYEARAVIVSGPTNGGTTSSGSGPFNTWVSIGSQSQWRVNTTSATPSILVIDVSIRNATTGTVLDTATITLNAHIGG